MAKVTLENNKSVFCLLKKGRIYLILSNYQLFQSSIFFVYYGYFVIFPLDKIHQKTTLSPNICLTSILHDKNKL